MKNYILLLTLIVVLISCTDKLDVKPTAYVDIEKAISSADGLTSLRNSSYAYSRQVYGRYYYHFAELLADTGEIIYNGSYEEFRDLKNKSLVSTFQYALESWRYSYLAINGCNLILDNLAVVEDEEEKASLEGHAKFLRGLLYFDLTRFFSLPYGDDNKTTPAVPLILTGTINPDQITYPSKATIGEIFTQVEKDLTDASQLLPSNETFFANKYAAMAILSRYYLTIEDFQKAAAMADSVIESGMFELVTNPFNAYNQKVNCREDIMAWQQTELDNEGANNDGMAPFYANTDVVGRADMEISEDFILATFSGDDNRGQMQLGPSTASDINSMYYEGFGESSGGFFSSKWMDYKTNLTFIRLAEMYLTRAEANFHILQDGGSKVGSNSPTEDIAVIRKRAGLDVSAMPTVTLAEIQFERYKELIFEGHRLLDDKRWEHNIGNIPWNSERLIIPIPKKETDTNPNL